MTDIKKCLVIDDCEDTQFIAKKTLESNGYNAVTTDNGTDGARICLENKPDLVLLDWNLIDIDGIDLIKKIRQFPECQDIKIIMCSGHNEKDKIDHAIQNGADGYLVKPFSDNEMITKIKSL